MSDDVKAKAEARRQRIIAKSAERVVVPSAAPSELVENSNAATEKDSKELLRARAEARRKRILAKSGERTALTDGAMEIKSKDSRPLAARRAKEVAIASKRASEALSISKYDEKVTTPAEEEQDKEVEKKFKDQESAKVAARLAHIAKVEREVAANTAQFDADNTTTATTTDSVPEIKSLPASPSTTNAKVLPLPYTRNHFILLSRLVAIVMMSVIAGGLNSYSIHRYSIGSGAAGVCLSSRDANPRQALLHSLGDFASSPQEGACVDAGSLYASAPLLLRWVLWVFVSPLPAIALARGLSLVVLQPLVLLMTGSATAAAAMGKRPPLLQMAMSLLMGNPLEGILVFASTLLMEISAHIVFTAFFINVIDTLLISSS